MEVESPVGPSEAHPMTSSQVEPKSSTVPTDPVGDRIDLLLAVARALGTGIPLDEMVSLLPARGPTAPSELTAWFRDHPQMGLVREGVVFPSGTETNSQRIRERIQESARRMEMARAAFDGPLGSLAPFLKFVAVTGSTAFDSAERQDDLDLFVVTKNGSLWIFLLLAYLLARFRWDQKTTLCLNYVLDESTARNEFLVSRRSIFAREALAMKPILNPEYGRKMLARAAWIREFFPRKAKDLGSPSKDAPLESHPGAALISAVVFPLLSSYLMLVGLYRNHRYRGRGEEDGVFRTEVGWGRLTYRSHKYDRLISLYDEPDSIRLGPKT